MIPTRPSTLGFPASARSRRAGRRSAVHALLLAALLGAPAGASAQVPSPSDVFPFEWGADYELADYALLTEYYRALADASPRVELREIGRSVLDQPLFVLVISSEANLGERDRWREISEALSRGRVDEAEARRMAREGRTVVWIDAGLHASELGHGQMAPMLAYRVATGESDEMRKIRDNVVLLLMPEINPDGLDIVADWYLSHVGTPWEVVGREPPILYHHFIGHDNNRDFFMCNMPESRAANRVLYREWYPQIDHNHHQTGPDYTRIFIPPIPDPKNRSIHPGVVAGINEVGTAMASRFAAQGKEGVISDSRYSMWYNGSIRTTAYFHNQIGILTETSHALPSPRYYDPETFPAYIGEARGALTPTDGTSNFYYFPWRGGELRFRDPMEYMITASMGLLDVAADRREKWLLEMYLRARDAIEEGEAGPGRAWVIPAEQWDRTAARSFLDLFLCNGIEVERATAAFEAGGRRFAAGSYVIPGDQAFRPFVVDMMEPQDYPDRRLYADGPPEPPYDLAGWTPAMQMGVDVVRLDEAYRAPTEAVTAERAPVVPGEVRGSAGFGWALSPRANGSYAAANRLLAAGESVFRADVGFRAGGAEHPAGTFVVERGGDAGERVRGLARELGVDFTGLSDRPGGSLRALERPRVGLYKSWVASMDEGWTRWVFLEHDFQVDTLHDADLRERDLSRYHAIVLPSQSPDELLNGHLPGTYPEPYSGGMGLEGALALQRFVRAGGTLVTFDAAADFAVEQLGLPVRNVLRGLGEREFFIPGSLIRIAVDTEHPLARGMRDEAAAQFQRSRAFEPVRLSRMGEGGEAVYAPEAPPPPVEVVARYADSDLLMSGWAMGEEEHLAGRGAMLAVRHGEGDVVLFGFRPQFRGQPRGTFKLLFNALFGAAEGERTSEE